MGKQTIVGDGKQVYQFEFSTVDGVVNAEDGVIEGVSVITGGVRACDEMWAPIGKYRISSA